MHDGTRRVFLTLSTLAACGLLVFYGDIENSLSTASLRPSHLFGSVGHKTANLTDTLGSVGHNTANLTDTLGSVGHKTANPTDTLGSVGHKTANLTDTLGSVGHNTANLTDTLGPVSHKTANLTDGRITSLKETSSQATLPVTMATVAPPDISHIDYLITNNICRNNNNNITALVLVTSHAGNLVQRQLVRAAYPAHALLSLGLRRVFLLATPTANQTEPGRHYFPASNDQIVAENRLHADLLQVDLPEGYDALTLKNLAGLRWASAHCARARFILKTDDDVIVDLYQLTELLRDVREEDKDAMIGRVWNRTVPRRFKASKYYISYEEWRPYFLPVYTSGIVYATSPKTAQALVDTSSTVPFFKMEDVYITGMVGARLGLRYVDVGDRFTNLNRMGCCHDDRATYQCAMMAGLNEQRNDITLLERVAQHSRRCHVTGTCQMLDGRDTTKMDCF